MPPGVVLRQVQKNEVLEIVVAAGLDPSQFDWASRRYSSGPYQGVADVLTHRGSDYFFEFRLLEETKHYAWFSPGTETVEASLYTVSWRAQTACVARWAADLNSELSAPDLWDSLRASGSLGELPLTFEGNTHFSLNEAAQLSERLDVIGARLAQVVDRDDLRLVAEDLVAHLREEISKQGRWDWFFLATGALMNFMANAAFEPHRAKELIQILIAGIRSLGPG